MYQQKKQRRDMENTEREHLLNRKFAPNSETAIDLDYSLQHHNQMQNAHQGVDDMLSSGMIPTRISSRNYFYKF